MARIELTTRIAAPAARVFDLARSIDLHRESMAHTREEVMGGVTTGLIGRNQHVVWRARHFGLNLWHDSRIVQFDPPRHFRDSMDRGLFDRFAHDHYFDEAEDGTTTMRDVLEFASPLGWLGRLVDRLVLRRYLARLIRNHCEHIKRVAESDRWREFLPAEPPPKKR